MRVTLTDPRFGVGRSEMATLMLRPADNVGLLVRGSLRHLSRYSGASYAFLIRLTCLRRGCGSKGRSIFVWSFTSSCFGGLG